MILERQCPRCSGDGVVFAPAWKAWHERNHPPYPASETDPEPPGPEEPACPDCEGSGLVLTEDGKAVALLVHRLLNERRT